MIDVRGTNLVPQQQKFAFKRDFVQMLTEKKAWPPHSQQANLLRPWRSSGIKRPIYTKIRAGGSATRRDLNDLLKIHIEEAYKPFSEVVESYLGLANIAPKNLTLTSLFQATTVAVESVDYMATGGAALFDLIPRFWANPLNHLTGLSTDTDIAMLAEWIRTVEGRQLGGDEDLTVEHAAKAFYQTWGHTYLDFDRQFQEWSMACPWTTLFSGYIDTGDGERFVRTGGSVVLPLSESAYDAIASGHRRFDDIHLSDLQVPCSGVYLYGTCEHPFVCFEEATRNSLTALMWQIAALTADGHVRALAPSPIPLSETRLKKSGFQQIGLCTHNSWNVPLWEMHANWIQQSVLTLMRFVLRNDGFLACPPLQ